MEHAHIEGRYENKTHSYLLKDYEITMERQRPTDALFYTTEPVDTSQPGLISIGYDGKLFEKSILRVSKCQQLGAELYENKAIEPVRDVFDQDYKGHEIKVTYIEAMRRLASKFGFTFVNKSSRSFSQRENLILLNTVRNALDQFRDIYHLKQERVRVDLIRKEIQLIDARINDEAVELAQVHFNEESDGEIEYKPIPDMEPYILVKHREKESIVDKVTFSKIEQSMKMVLVDG